MKLTYCSLMIVDLLINVVVAVLEREYNKDVKVNYKWIAYC
jgi:hypothetical protein